MIPCKTCALIARRDQSNAPLWDCIYRTSLWDVAHCYETALLGWIVLVARRHISSLVEMTEQEAVEMGRLIRSISWALKEVVGCAKTYVLQFAEAPEHRHVHFHIIPRAEDLPDDHRSIQIFKYLGVPEDERVHEEKMNTIAFESKRNTSG